MRKTRIVGLLSIGFVAAAILGVYAQQNIPNVNRTQTEAGIALVYVIPISATAAVNTQTTLTIPAPAPGEYNYVCELDFSASQNGTATANTNAVTTSTNFNAFALKFSHPATANATYDKSLFFGEPTTGCAKSTSPGTATTFVSPAAATNTAYTWYATYFQRP